MPCRNDSYSIDLGGSDASSVDDARQMEATATATGFEVGFGLAAGGVDVRTNIEQVEPAATDKLTIVTSANVGSAVESTKPPKSTSRSTRSGTRSGTRSSSRSSSSRRHRSRSRSSRRAASPGPGLPKASTSSIADRSHLLDELDGLVASFSMPSAATSNDRESDSGDEFDGLEESVIGVVPLPGEESTPVEAKGKDGKAADTTEDFPQAINGAIVPFDADDFRYGDSRALVPAVGTDDNNANADDKMEEDKVQLAIGSAPKMCAYEVTAEDVDAVTKSNNDMMVVHEPNTKGNAEDNHFGDRFTFQRDETRDDQACKDHHSSAIVPTTGVAPPMLTPPNDPNKSMPSELYLSPESEEDEDEDRLFSEGLFAVPLLMPDGYQAETTTSTTEIVPHASNTTNTNEESNANAIVEFAGDTSSLIPAGYDFGDHPPMPTKTSKSVEPQEQSNNTAGEAEIEAQLCGPTEDKFDEVAKVTESSKTVVSVETQQTETKVAIPENPHTKPVTSSMSVASMSRLSRRAKNYRATAINKGTRTETKKAVQGTTDNAAAVDKSKAVVEEEVSIAETKSIDLSIIECNSDETEVSEITSNHTDLDEASVTSKASHRARQLRSRSAVRHGRGMSVERRGGMSDDKEIKDPSTASVKSALPPVPKAASITSVNGLSTEPSDGGKTEDHPSTTTSSCRLARSRRSRSRSVRRATSVQQRSRTTATKKDEEVGGEKKDDSPQTIDESIGQKVDTIDSEPKEQDKKEEEIKMTSDSKSNGDAANEQMKTTEANNIVEKKNTSTRSAQSQSRKMAGRLGKDTCVRAILGEKDTSAINNGDSQKSVKPKGPPAPQSNGKSSQSLRDRKARAARMKKAVDASSISSSSSVGTSSSSVENGENNAAPVDDTTSKPSKTVDSMEKSIQDKKEMTRKRSERARRLRALQN